MAVVTRNTEREVKTLDENLKDMAVDMRLFSLTLRSLYVLNAVGTNEQPAKEFRRLRDDTRNDAMVYLKCILPVSTKFVSSISEYFEYYDALNYEEWCEMLPDILQETTGYKELCGTVLQMHEDILVPLKKRKDEALLLVTKFKDLKEEYERKIRELEQTAETKRSWAFGLLWIPFVNVIASPLLGASADSDMAKAVAKGQQAKIQEAASMAVSKALIPALENFINGIKKAAGFFSVMEQELMKFENKASNAVDDPKKLHYMVMKKEARDMKSTCQIFYAVLPDVRTDFLAIPTEGTDQNYVDQWLEKQEKTIREKCSVPGLVGKLLKAITK
ncbi:PREDICTED: uncharacterized protein LOC107346827 isoform X1 [Acropora digitifera]|uniref:uncharacterized protein LOC107346827 isoform X1 n=1 Tax=Acropora digitifera TaxID=70779 RepID=UPI00077AB23D|nr:PREDICTED: uncharacterized protein LOC107346827 isoform X1 [Acropora digitifera]